MTSEGSVWGSCVDIGFAEAADASKWHGTNVLGWALAEARQQHKEPKERRVLPSSKSAVPRHAGRFCSASHDLLLRKKPSALSFGACVCAGGLLLMKCTISKKVHFLIEDRMSNSELTKTMMVGGAIGGAVNALGEQQC